MANGGSPGVRIEAAALGNLVRRDWSDPSEFAVERRVDGNWMRVGLFGDAGQAMEAIDEAVGRGEGSLGDYEVEVIPLGFLGKHAWVLPAVVVAAILWLGWVLWHLLLGA